MKKKYTKKQIMESIKYWQKQLKLMNESSDASETWIKASNRDFNYAPEDPWLYVTQTNDCFVQPTRKIGCSRTDGPSGESFRRKLIRYSTSTNAGWKPAYQLVFPKEKYSSSIFNIEKEFDDFVIQHGGNITGTHGGGRELFAIDDARLSNAIVEFQEKYPEMEVYVYAS